MRQALCEPWVMDTFLTRGLMFSTDQYTGQYTRNSEVWLRPKGGAKF